MWNHTGGKKKVPEKNGYVFILSLQDFQFRNKKSTPR